MEEDVVAWLELWDVKLAGVWFGFGAEIGEVGDGL